jgi:hypothetical protein
VIEVVPAAYAALPLRQRYDVARAIGRVHRASPEGGVLLMGPGRWCTSSPELGVPTVFAEVSRSAVLVEWITMRPGLTPEPSYGSHLLNELIAKDLLYLAISPVPDGGAGQALLRAARNRLPDLLPGAEALREVLRVTDAADLAPGGARVTVCADSRARRAAAYVIAPDRNS